MSLLILFYFSSLLDRPPDCAMAPPQPPNTRAKSAPESPQQPPNTRASASSAKSSPAHGRRNSPRKPPPKAGGGRPSEQGRRKSSTEQGRRKSSTKMAAATVTKPGTKTKVREQCHALCFPLSTQIPFSLIRPNPFRRKASATEKQKRDAPPVVVAMMTTPRHLRIHNYRRRRLHSSGRRTWKKEWYGRLRLKIVFLLCLSLFPFRPFRVRFPF